MIQTAKGIYGGTPSVVAEGTPDVIFLSLLNKIPDCSPMGSSMRVQVGFAEKTLGEVPGGTPSEKSRRVTREIL